MQLRPALPRSLVRPHRLSRYLLASILLVVAAAYTPALQGPFIWDDRALIVGEPAVQAPAPLLSYFARPFWRNSPDGSTPRGLYRPLVTLSYVLDYRLHGENPAGFHVTNLAFHLLNCALLFALARRLRAGPAEAATCAVLWGLFPRLSESVSWISGRTDVLATSFVLLTLLAWDPQRRGRRVLAALLLVAGLLCKEVAVAAAAALVAGELVGVRDRERTLGQACRRLLPLGIAGAAYGALRIVALLGESKALGQQLQLGALGRCACVLETAGTYLLMIADGWRPRTQIGLLGRPEPALVALGAAALAALFVALTRAARSLDAAGARAAVLSLGSLALVLHAVPLPTDVIAADRFLYLPLCGAALLLARALGGAGPRLRAALLPALALLAGSYGAALHHRNLDWADEVRFWTDALKTTRPDNGRPLLELGNLYYRSGLYEEAIPLYRGAADAARATPVQYGLPGSALGNIANCQSQLGRYDEALVTRRWLSEREPYVPKHHLDLALLGLHMGRFDLARAGLGEALRLLPDYPAARTVAATLDGLEQEKLRLDALPVVEPVLAAELLTRLGRRPAAQRAWLAVARAPGAAPDSLRRAAAYLLLFGSLDSAAEGLMRLQQRAPTDPDGARMAELLGERRDLVRRLKEVPGIGQAPPHSQPAGAPPDGGR